MEKPVRRRKRIYRGAKVRTDTIYAVASVVDQIYLILPRAALIGGVLILPLIAPDVYWQKVLCITGVFALLAIALDFLLNFTGLLCLGMGFFVGVGGYVSGMLSGSFGLSTPLAIVGGTIIGALVCTLAYLPCLPLRGIYFAVVSFMYPLTCMRFITATGWLGGTDGITGVGMLSNLWVSQYLVLGLGLICVFGFRRLVNENIGIIFRGIKDNDQAITASGLNITYYKILAVFIAALMGCFSGAFLAHLYGWAGLSLFALDFSIFPLAATIVGGVGTIAGPMIGTFLLEPLSEMLRSVSGLRIIFFSVVILLCISFWSEGLLNWAREKYEKFEFWTEV